MRVAKKGKKSRPKIDPPALLVPFLSFKNMPNKAKDVVLEVLDTDDAFRERVAKGVTEAEHGRFTHDYLLRPNGWETFIANMVEADGPASDASSGSVAELEDRLMMATAARATAEADAQHARRELTSAEDELEKVCDTNDVMQATIADLRREVDELTVQRQQTVSELKTTESVMARHIAARKQLEATIEQMTSAQLSSTTVGGAITDEEVRVGLDAIEFTMHDLRSQLDSLRRAATPERVTVSRRVPLAPPLGLANDSVEFANYLLSIPNIVVFVDGYNVTKLVVPELELADQRRWIEQRITTRLATMSGRFEVIFDGADVVAGRGTSHPQLRIRFSPDGVEADDVIINDVSATDSRHPVAVVSSDKRVREGAATGGANVLDSRQFSRALS